MNIDIHNDRNYHFLLNNYHEQINTRSIKITWEVNIAMNT